MKNANCLLPDRLPGNGSPPAARDTRWPLWLALSSTLGAAACGTGPAEVEPPPESAAATAGTEDMSVPPEHAARTDERNAAAFGSAQRDRLACSDVRADVPVGKRPADIIFVIDNSGSMTEEIVAVQNTINTNFADVFNRSGLDYRVVMVSSHGNATTQQSICVSMPLSTITCSPVPSMPGNNPPRFYQYSIEIESTDSLQRILSSYDGVQKDKFNLAPAGWSTWLRPEAFKVFIEITDDESALNYATFDTQLLAKGPTQFGTAAKRNYVFHTIGGFRENSPPTKAWGPADPIVTSRCTRGFSVNPSTQYQNLSILTGGLRYPICEFGSFSSIFESIATGVLTSGPAACTFPLPVPADGQKVDRSSVTLEFTPTGAGSPVVFGQGASAAECTPNSFYLDGDQVRLCPDACAQVQKDATGKLQIVYDCEPLGKPDGQACLLNTECASGACTDGVCCNSSCGGGSDGDCQVCSRAKGAVIDGVCAPVAAGTTCRASSGVCDVAETCNGLSLACPADVVRPSGTVCRASGGVCDAAEVCTGTSGQCPADALAPAGTVCRAATSACDAAEVCSGTSAACPANGYAASGTLCRPAAGPCDVAEVCSGVSTICPVDKLRTSSTTCRAAAGTCDAAEKCSGTSADCPADKLKTNITVCRAAAGPCDSAEFCSGTGVDCPTDQFKPFIAVCRPAAGTCDLVDYCTGASPACPPDDLLAAGTVCRGAVSACDQDEVCSGTKAACPADAPQPDGTSCPGGLCKAGMCQ